MHSNGITYICPLRVSLQRVCVCVCGFIGIKGKRTAKTAKVRKGEKPTEKGRTERRKVKGGRVQVRKKKDTCVVRK